MGRWLWVLVDGILAILAGFGAMFLVVMVLYALYRFACLVGRLVRLMFGEARLDGIPRYEEDDYP